MIGFVPNAEPTSRNLNRFSNDRYFPELVMKNIQPSIVDADIICAESPAGATAMVVFGASGDLAGRKLLSSLAALFKRKLIGEKFFLIGAGRKQLSDEQFRQHVKNAIADSPVELSPQKLGVFLQKLYYINGDYSKISFYEQIRTKTKELSQRHQVDETCIFYLSVPPFLYESIIEGLGATELSCSKKPLFKQTRVIVEKPFGRDLASAVELNKKICQCFDESQIYRIDHYLGKETVQNLMMFRFANSIFEPLWNRNYIDHIQITIAEQVGVEHRAGYYDKTGALRDMFQNHMLQLLALVAMEAPISFDAEAIRDEKIKLLNSVRPFDIDNLDDYIIRAQYKKGLVDGKEAAGYLAESGVEDGSKTETFTAAKMFIDNLRWKDVPFYLRTGKRLAGKDTEIAVVFKQVAHSMFASAGLGDIPPNVLVFQLQPAEGVSLSFQAKRPGSKVCMATLKMDFDYKEVFGVEIPEAYQRLLLDCMVGDQALFMRSDSVEAAWSVLTPVLQHWQKNDSHLYEYPAGADSFPEADKLIQSDGRNWRKLMGV